MSNKRLAVGYLLESKKIKTDSVLEGFINYISISSLESIAIINIVTILWKQPDLREAIQQHVSKFGARRGSTYSEKENSFDQIEKKLSEKLCRLPLPDSLKAKMTNIIRPIGLQLLEWMDYTKRDYFHFHHTIKCMNYICWTMEGIIDKAKTLKLQYNNQSLEKYISDVYVLASKYCLEDFIANLWGEIPGETKGLIINTAYKKMDDLLAYWVCFSKNTLSEFLSIIKRNDYRNICDCNHSIYQNIFTLSISDGNALAAKYFWHKLTPEEISNNIETWTNMAVQSRIKCRQYDYQETNAYTDILCFLLSQMNDKEQQKRVLQKYSHILLEWLFLDWPWQKFLLPTIRVMWDFLDDKVYVNLLSKVSLQIRNGRTTEKILREIWCNSPIRLKKEFIAGSRCCINVLWKLLKVKDIVTITLIINDATAEEKKQIIWASTKEKEELFNIIYTDYSLFDTLIGEMLSSQYEISNFKENILLTIGYRLCHDWICNDNWQSVENLLAWGFTSQNQIDNFKSKVINKISIVNSLMCVGNYKLADKFMSWYFSGEEAINQFKKEFVYYKNYVIVTILNDWTLFEKLVDWCFKSDLDVNQFKIDISQYDKMERILYNVIVYDYNFKFANQLLCWCFNSKEEIKDFKRKLILSEVGMEMFIKFVTNYKVCVDNWKLVKRLTRWYYPLEEEVIIEFKNVVKDIRDEIFCTEKSGPFYSAKGKEQALFYILDVYARNDSSSNYSSGIIFADITDDDSNDSSCDMDSHVMHILSNIMDDSDDNSGDYDLDIVILLNDLLNQVHKGCFGEGTVL